MTLDLAALRQRQSDARARAQAARNNKTDLLSMLNKVGEDVAKAEIDEAKAKHQAKLAKEEEERQERLRASQRAYLEQQAAAGLNTSEFEEFAWYEGIFDHQLEGIKFGAAAKRFVLGDEPGLGKTRTAIGWLDSVEAQKVILIAPQEVAEQFSAELQELAEHRTVIDFRSVSPQIRAARQERLLECDEAVAVLNYEATRDTTTGLMGALLTWRADTLVADEAHLIRNTETAIFQHIQRIVGTDLYCGMCRREVACLLRQEFDNQGKKKGPPVRVPCPHCGWKKGEPANVEFSRKIDEYLHTKSIQNVALLTGTPLLNSPEELFALFNIVRPDLFPQLRSFRKTFTYADSAGHRYFTSAGLANLRTMLQPVYLARTKSEVILPDGRTLEETIPDREIHDVMVPIEYDEYPQQRTVIDQIRKFSQIQLASGQKLAIMEQLAQITRQRQANVFPGGIEVTETDPETGEKRVVFTTALDIDEAAKMDSILEHAVRHSDERQVVFSQFSTALVELEQRFKDAGFKVVRLDGSTTKSLRTQIKSNFYKAKQEKPKWDVVLVNYKTGGAGLNLTSCTITHLMDSEWNPGNEDQALHRTYRIGQDEETTVYRYLTPKTIDIRIEAIKRRKRKLVEAFQRGEIEVLKFNKGSEIAEALNAS